MTMSASAAANVGVKGSPSKTNAAAAPMNGAVLVRGGARGSEMTQRHDV